MKKRNAAALLLTLGLTVSGNGMVFAAEQVPEAPAETSHVSRIVSFTDYTGMRVTYDANVSQQYVYEVEEGILKAVRWKEAAGEEGEASETVKFEGNVELKQPEEGEKYTSVAADVFGDNQLITYVKLPAGVTTVAKESFKGCTALKSVYLPSTVNRIEDDAFEGCTDMTQICLPKAVTAIGDNAFKGNTALQTVQIRDVEESQLASVGAHAFAGCRDLQQITIPQTAAVGEGAFEDGTTVTAEEQAQ